MKSAEKILVDTFAVGPLQCNCTILGDIETHDAIVIDPGGDPEEILGRLARHGLVARQIVCTHTHIDHVGAICELQEAFQTRASIHRDDLHLYERLDVQAQWIGLPMPKRGTIDGFIADGDNVACGGIEIGAIHTPGHTPGSTTFQFSADRTILFTGDTLFHRGIGRTDLWGGSQTAILKSIQGRLMTFDDDTLVIAGHGRSTTIGAERHNNPFLR